MDENKKKINKKGSSCFMTCHPNQDSRRESGERNEKKKKNKYTERLTNSVLTARYVRDF